MGGFRGSRLKRKFLGYIVVLPSALSLHFLWLRFYISFSSDGPLKDWDPWVCGGLTTPVGICIEGWSGVGSGSESIILFLSITVSYRSQLSSLFSLPLFVVCDIGSGIGPSSGAPNLERQFPSDQNPGRRGLLNEDNMLPVATSAGRSRGSSTIDWSNQSVHR